MPRQLKLGAKYRCMLEVRCALFKLAVARRRQPPHRFRQHGSVLTIPTALPVAGMLRREVTDTLPEQGCVITNPRDWLDRPAQRCMPSGLALSYAAQSLSRAALCRPRRCGHGRRPLGLAGVA